MTSAAQLAVAGSAMLERAAQDPYLARARELGRDGRLQLQRCGNCGYLRYPPAGVCPECLSWDATWIEDSGAGSIWSFCVYRRSYAKPFADLIPYNVALVELDSGPRLITNVVDVEPDRLRIGARGTAAPVPLPGGGSLVYFTVGSEGEK